MKTGKAAGIKSAARTAAFLIVTAIAFSGVCKVLWLRDGDYSTEILDGFYSLPRQSTDVIWIGGSSVLDYFITAEAFHTYGVAAYPIANAQQPFKAAMFLVKEALKTQNPKVILIDTRTMDRAHTLPHEGAIRWITDAIKFSKNRIDMLNYILNNNLFQGLSNNFDYYFSFTKYHSRWNQLGERDFGYSPSLILGYHIVPRGRNITAFDDHREEINAVPVPIPADSERVLLDLLEFCKTIDTKIIFTNTPNRRSAEEFASWNYVNGVIRDNGFEVVNMNELQDEIGIDPIVDFNDSSHVNILGAQKVTAWISKYLRERHNLPDRRGDKRYVLWENEYQRSVPQLLHEITAMRHYLNLIDDPRFSVFITARGEAFTGLDAGSTGLMENLGLKADFTGKEAAYIAVIDRGAVVDEQSAKAESGIQPRISGRLADGTSYAIHCGGVTIGNNHSIIVDGIEYSVDGSGLNFVIYDNETRKVIDSVLFDAGGAAKRL